MCLQLVLKNESNKDTTIVGIRKSKIHSLVVTVHPKPYVRTKKKKDKIRIVALPILQS